MKKMIVVCGLIVFVAGCGGKVTTNLSMTGKDEFLEITRFIMTKEEIDIYKHLPDNESRENFIYEFWEKRDPSYGTEQNENRDEYEKRIRFANQWFRERPDGKGWDTDRGRILLQMGFPDERNERVTTKAGTTWQVRIEEWFYYGSRIGLRFIEKGGQGRFQLDQVPSELRKALERNKFVIDLIDKKPLSPSKTFKFRTVYKNNAVHISFPVKHLLFQWDKETGKMNALFEIEIFVYRNFKKQDHIKLNKKFSADKKEILKQKEVSMVVPYPVTAGSRYYFDVIIKDPVSGTKYRNFCRYK